MSVNLTKLIPEIKLCLFGYLKLMDAVLLRMGTLGGGLLRGEDREPPSLGPVVCGSSLSGGLSPLFPVAEKTMKCMTNIFAIDRHGGRSFSKISPY